MNRPRRHTLAAGLALLLLLLPSTVFAKELGLLTISGPGIKGDVTVSDPSVLAKLEGSGFFDQSNRLKGAPENLGEGYTITSALNLDGKMTPFVEMVYYPIEAGQPGYMHVTGRLDGTSLRKVDEWSQLPAEADSFFRTVMAAEKITLLTAVVAAPAVAAVQPEPQNGQPVSAPGTAPAPTPAAIPYPAVAVGLVTLGALGAALVLRRRTLSQRST